MLKHLMSGASLIALALRDTENEQGSAAEAKAKLREEIAKGNLPPTNGVTPPPEPKEEDEEDEDDDEEDEEDEDEEGEEEDKSKVEETAEAKAEREKQEKIAAKAQRKQDRVQRRIDELTAREKAANEEVARLKAQLAADPEKRLTEEEVETRAKEIAKQEKAQADLKKLQDDFDADCEKLAKDATKIDKDFNAKVHDMAEQFGAIPSFMIGVLSDMDNGAEVLATLVNDDDEAERIYGLSNKPAKMAKELSLISIKLEEAKKPPKKKISKVPDPITPVQGSRSTSTVLTEADAKNMDTYVAKRQRQMAEKRKAQGF